MDPFKNQIDERTSYTDLDEQFHTARLDRSDISQSDWPSQIDRAAIDVAHGVALGTADTAFDFGATIGRNDFGNACGDFYVQGLQALSDRQSDLPQLISEYSATELGELAFRLNELRVELTDLDLADTGIGNLNRVTEALVEKLITRNADENLTRHSLHQPEAVNDLLFQLFSDPSVATYADILMNVINGEKKASIAGRGLLHHLDRPQMVTPLWDHQKDAIKNWVQTDQLGYVNMATATGKTVLGLAAIAYKFGDLHPADSSVMPAKEKSNTQKARVLVVAGQDLLLEQWQSEFDEHLNIPKSRTRQNQDADERSIRLEWGTVEFRTAQELLSTDSGFGYDLVIMDEVHRYTRGGSGSRGWRDLFEELIEGTDSMLAMSGSIDDEWLGDSSVKDMLESYLTQCIEFTIEEAREKNVIADFRWDICYASSARDETVAGVAESTQTLAQAYNAIQHKFEPHKFASSIPQEVPETFETLRDLRSYAHTKDGKKARDIAPEFDKFATAAFSRRPKRWQLSPPAETISDLLSEHIQDRKCVVLVQSYNQASVIAAHVEENFGESLIYSPDKDTGAPFDVIEEFKQSNEGVLIGPGDVLGTGVDLPEAGVAINLAKGGVNASLIQRIGRILRNPQGDKSAHFYQIVTLPALPEARLAGEDGRRLLRRASEFRALGARFQEHPGFVAADSEASAIVGEVESAGAQAKIKDQRTTEEIVSDDIAVDLLDEITSIIEESDTETQERPNLITYWQPESLTPGTEQTKDVDSTDEEREEASGGNSDTTKGLGISISATDVDGNPIENANIELTGGTSVLKEPTDNQGRAEFTFAEQHSPLSISVSHPGYDDYAQMIYTDSRSESVDIELQPNQETTADEADKEDEVIEADEVESSKEPTQENDKPLSSDESQAEFSSKQTQTISLLVKDHDGACLTNAKVSSPLEEVNGEETSELGLCEISFRGDHSSLPLQVEYVQKITEIMQLELVNGEQFYELDIERSQWEPQGDETSSNDSEAEDTHSDGILDDILEEIEIDFETEEDL